MREYVKILSGATSARMFNSDHVRHVRICRSETNPGEGWYPVEKILPKPIPADGEELGYTYTVRDGVAYKEYFVARLPRVFSKLKVVAALTEAGAWAQVKAWIEANGLYDLYLAAQEFAEDNDYFARGLAALKPVVGWTDEQVEAMLAKCVKEGD